jgi:hypothetical protein
MALRTEHRAGDLLDRVAAARCPDDFVYQATPGRAQAAA